jgi:hypothetical protein
MHDQQIQTVELGGTTLDFNTTLGKTEATLWVTPQHATLEFRSIGDGRNFGTVVIDDWSGLRSLAMALTTAAEQMWTLRHAQPAA